MNSSLIKWLLAALGIFVVVFGIRQLRDQFGPTTLEPGIELKDDSIVADAKSITQLQRGCLDSAPLADCAITDERVVQDTGIAAIAAAITYHNDSVDGRDNTVDLLFRKLFIDTTYSNNTVTYQHTHGTEHALVVLAKEAGDQCKPKATMYPLRRGDSVEIYYDTLQAPPVALSHSHSFDVRLSLQTRHDHGEMGCKHPGTVPSRNLFWKIETPTQHDFLGNENVFNNLPATLTEVHETQPSDEQRYLRKIVVRGKNGKPRHAQDLTSGCSAWRLCTRTSNPASCDQVPLCPIYFTRECETCVASTIAKPRAKE